MKLESSQISLSLWVDWLPPSLNKTKYAHWTVNLRHTKAAKAAWLLSLKSSPTRTGPLMMIISALAHTNHYAMQSQGALVSMTETRGCVGDTDKSKPKE